MEVEDSSTKKINTLYDLNSARQTTRVALDTGRPMVDAKTLRKYEIELPKPTYNINKSYIGNLYILCLNKNKDAVFLFNMKHCKYYKTDLT